MWACVGTRRNTRVTAKDQLQAEEIKGLLQSNVPHRDARTTFGQLDPPAAPLCARAGHELNKNVNIYIFKHGWFSFRAKRMQTMRIFCFTEPAAEECLRKYFTSGNSFTPLDLSLNIMGVFDNRFLPLRYLSAHIFENPLWLWIKEPLCMMHTGRWLTGRASAWQTQAVGKTCSHKSTFFFQKLNVQN